MEEQTVRAAINRHWAASAAGDQVTEHEIYHDDTVCIYPQSGEVIHGRQNLQALRSHHPGKPSGFVVRRIVGEGNLWVTEYAIDYEGKSAFTVSIMEFRVGRSRARPSTLQTLSKLRPGASSGSKGSHDRHGGQRHAAGVLVCSTYSFPQHVSISIEDGIFFTGNGTVISLKSTT